MQKYNTVYYLLFVLLVTGCFASMAQNEYGIFIMGFVAAGFSILFLSHLFRDQIKSRLVFVELISLSVLSAILTLRIFYIHFNFVEVLFVVAGLLLIGFYSNQLFQSWRKLERNNKKLGGLAILFYGSIISYLLSMVTVPFFPQLAEPFGGIAFFLIIVFFVLGIKRDHIIEEGEKVSGIDHVSKHKDRSVVLIFLFLLFTAYMGFTKINVLPKMYSDEYPQAYFELVNRAESGREAPENGKYKHQQFKVAYDSFTEKGEESE